MILGAGIFAAFAYCTAAFVLLREFIAQQIRKPLLARSLAFAALTAHLAVVVSASIEPAGVNVSFYSALVLLSFVIALLIFTGGFFAPVRSLGIIAYPLSALCLLVYATVGRGSERVVGYPWQLDLHIALSLFAFGLLLIAAGQALVLAYQEYMLRRKKFGSLIHRLPPLSVSENLLFQIITLGFILLSLALISGIPFVTDIGAQHLLHKVVLAAIAWVVFGVLLMGRLFRGWRGRTAIRMTLGGSFVLLLSYLGSKLVLELILQRVS